MIDNRVFVFSLLWESWGTPVGYRADRATCLGR